MTPSKKINVLMVTGVYLPESNGAVLQCSHLIRDLSESINFRVLTATNHSASAGSSYVEGVSVTRVLMSKRHTLEYVAGAVRFYIQLIKLLRKSDLVHIHGFSRRNAIVIAISRILNKRVILKMTSFGQDDPSCIRKGDPISWPLFKRCHAYIGLSPAFAISYQESGLPEMKYQFIPNGVDLDRYSPASTGEKNTLRAKYGFPEDESIIIFVGHHSPEKRSMLLYQAWVILCEQNIRARIIFIGRTRDYYEVDGAIIELMRHDALRRGALPLIRFVEHTTHIDEYMRIADVFVLPSIREGLPNVLLEAMACALPCVVTNLPGVTDWLIDDGNTGVLFYSNNPRLLAEHIKPYLADPAAARQMGLAARKLIEDHFSSVSTSQAVSDLYRRTLSQTSDPN